jgi:hypothetical protein
MDEIPENDDDDPLGMSYPLEAESKNFNQTESSYLDMQELSRIETSRYKAKKEKRKKRNLADAMPEIK